MKADSTITLNRKLYEVPSRFIGTSVDVRIDEKGVYIYEDDKQVAESELVNIQDNAHVKRVRSPFTLVVDEQGGEKDV